jgi:hypothetical protein
MWSPRVNTATSLTGLPRGNTTAAEKKAYIAAVLCMLSPRAEACSLAEHGSGITKAPSKLPAASYPGAKSRYDDFVAIHIKNTMSIHGTVRLIIRLIPTQNLIPPRATFSRGTDTSHSHMSKLCGQNAGTMALSP